MSCCLPEPTQWHYWEKNLLFVGEGGGGTLFSCRWRFKEWSKSRGKLEDLLLNSVERSVDSGKSSQHKGIMTDSTRHLTILTTSGYQDLKIRPNNGEKET